MAKQTKVDTFVATLPGSLQNITPNKCPSKASFADNEQRHSKELVDYITQSLHDKGVKEFELRSIKTAGTLNTCATDPNKLNPRRQMVVVKGVTCCLLVQLYKMSDDYDPDAEPVELRREVIEVELVLSMFGVEILYCISNTDSEELCTAEGFYDLLKDPSLGVLISTAIHQASVSLYQTFSGERDEDCKDGGPAYQFADWILGDRGRGIEFKEK